jgi:hypothetical protein
MGYPLAVSSRGLFWAFPDLAVVSLSDSTGVDAQLPRR